MNVIHKTGANALYLTINQAGLLNSLGSAFSSSVSVVLELLQNARRAGATKIDVTCRIEDKVLIVEDDGSGVADPVSLITLGTSGWPTEIREAEQPFGVGLLAAIYQATELIVESADWRLHADTHQLLAGGGVLLESADFRQGTRIELRGLTPSMNLQSVLDQVRSRIMGFPIPVIINNESVHRPYVVQEAKHATDAGPTGNLFGDGSPHLIVQGISLGLTHRIDVPFIHLKGFAVTFPDRAGLIESGDAWNRINCAMAKARRDWLVARKEELSNQDFLMKCEKLCRQHAPDLLNDIPFVMSSWFRKQVVPGYRNRWPGDCSMTALSESDVTGLLGDSCVADGQLIDPIPMEALDGKVILDIAGLIDDPRECFDIDNEIAAFAAQEYARIRGDWILVADWLDQNHPLRVRVTKVDESEIKVVPIGINGGSFSPISGSYDMARLILCEHAEIQLACLPGRIAVASDHGFVVTKGLLQCLDHDLECDGCVGFVIQPQSSRSVAPVNQLDDFIFDDEFRQDELDRAERRFYESVLLPMDGPEAWLRTILGDVEWPACLQDKTFKVEIGVDGPLSVKILK